MRLRQGFLRRSVRSDALLLGLIVGIATTVYAVYALRVASFQQDESLYLHEARYIAEHFPGAMWTQGLFVRGLQRLDPLVLAAPFAFLRGPGAFEVDRVLQCLLFASTAVPVFLLARAAKLERGACFLAATLVIVVPWAVVSGSFLSESAAYPAYAWVLYAVWVACTRPSLKSLLLAVLAIIVAAFSRTAMIALVPLLPLAVLWQEWSCGLAGRGSSPRLRELPGRLWSRHRLLTAASAIVLLLYLVERLGLLPGSAHALTGEYGVPGISSAKDVFDEWRYYLSRAVAGTGLVAVAIGLPWAVLTLARPRDSDRHALAVVCVLGLFCMLLSLLAAPGDERYMMYAAVPIALMFAAALGQRAGIGVVIGAIVVDLLIEGVVWPPPAVPYDFFTYPAAVFYQRVLLGRVSLIPLGISPERMLEAIVIIVALLWMLATRRPRTARPAAVVLGLGVLVFCSAQTGYALRKYVDDAAIGSDASARSWVDRHVPSGARVGAVAVGLGGSTDYDPIWEETEYWNTSVEVDMGFQSTEALPIPVGSQQMHMLIQPDSGLITALSGPAIDTPTGPPEYVLYPLQGTNPIVLAGTVVATSSYLPLELLRLSRPARALWSLSGTSVQGFLAPKTGATATVYSGALTGLTRPCATFTLIAPPNFTGTWPYEVRSGHLRLHGSLRALQTLALTVPLSPRQTPRGPSASLAVAVHGEAIFAGTTAGAKLAFFKVEQCHGSAT